jgi:hypothetical protein
MVIRVKRYERQEQLQPQPRARLDERVSDSAFGAAAGAALQRTGAVIQQVQQVERDRADQSALLEADTAIDDWERGNLLDSETGAYTKRGKNALGLADQVLPNFDAESKRIEGTLGSERAKLAFRGQAQRRRQQISTNLERHEFTERSVYQEEQDQAKLASSSEMAASYYNDPARVADELTKQQAVLTAQAQRRGWSPEQLAEQQLKQRSGVHSAVLQAAATAGDYVYAEEYLAARGDEMTAAERTAAEQVVKQGQVIGRANGILAEYRTDATAGTRALLAIEQDETLQPEVKDRVRARVREGMGLIHAERRQEYGEQVTALERSISQDSPGANAESQARALYRRGAYTAEQYTNEMASVENAIATGQRLDPKDTDVVKAVDSYFVEATRVNQIAPGSDEWINSASAIANRTNILPPEAMSWARKTILSGEPDLAVPAANAMARWADAAPHAYAYFDDPQLKANAEAIDSMVRTGVAPEKAVEIARANTFDIPKARQDQLRADYGKKKYATDNAGELQSFLNSDDNFDRTVIGGAPAAPLAMRDEFDSLVRTYFDYTNGDISRARDLAWKDLRGTYGVSTVNGEPEVMKWAPELVFKGLPPEIVRSDIDEAAKSRGIKTPVRLTPSRVTGDSRGALWELSTVDDDGNAEILLDEKNRPLIYAIPSDTGAFARDQEAAKREAVERARAMSKSAREQAEAVYDLGAFPGY